MKKSEMTDLFLVTRRAKIMACRSTTTDERWYVRGFNLKSVIGADNSDFSTTLVTLNRLVRRELRPNSKAVVVGDGEAGICAVASALEEPRITAVTLFTPFDRNHSLSQRGIEGLDFLEREREAVDASNVITLVDLTKGYEQSLPGATVHKVGPYLWHEELITNRGFTLSDIITQHRSA